MTCRSSWGENREDLKGMNGASTRVLCLIYRYAVPQNVASDLVCPSLTRINKFI